MGAKGEVLGYDCQIMAFWKSLFGDEEAAASSVRRSSWYRSTPLKAPCGRSPTGQLRAKTAEFRERLAKEETLDALAPEAFAAVREASVRTLKQRHFDVQLIGGMVPASGRHCGDAHRRREDARGDLARVPERAWRQGGACGDGQRLPLASRCGVDGADLPLH